jgi:hypothetical protein
LGRSHVHGAPLRWFVDATIAVLAPRLELPIFRFHELLVFPLFSCACGFPVLPVDPLAAGLRWIVELRQLAQQLVGRQQRSRGGRSSSGIRRSGN